jgi:hypothetical protein
MLRIHPVDDYPAVWPADPAAWLDHHAVVAWVATAQRAGTAVARLYVAPEALDTLDSNAKAQELYEREGRARLGQAPLTMADGTCRDACAYILFNEAELR